MSGLLPSGNNSISCGKEATSKSKENVEIVEISQFEILIIWNYEPLSKNEMTGFLEANNCFLQDHEFKCINPK